MNEEEGKHMITMTKNDPVQAKEFFQEKMDFTTGPMEVSQQIREKADIAIIDVRAQADYHAGHVPGAMNLPKERWDTLEGLDRDRLNILYCYSQTCHLAAQAALEFASQGYSVMEMEGGFKAWKENDLKVEK
jgi:rhodanese-related sulfurtransferase